MNKKQTKPIKIKSVRAWAKIPDCSLLGEPMQIYSTKKEAENAVSDMYARMYGVDYLTNEFKSDFITKIIPVLITPVKK